MMKLAMDSASMPAPYRRIVSMFLFPATCLAMSGCAGWSSVGEQRTRLAGAFWNRPGTAAQAPGYDLYAESMAARSKAAKDPTSANGASIPEEKDGTAPSLAVETAPPDDSRRAPSTPGRDGSAGKTNDASIRVTLGRPESLPTLADAGRAATPLLASTATNWKRPGETVVEASSVPRPRQMSSRSKGPSEAPDSARRVAGQPARPASGEDKLQTILTKAKSRLAAMPTYQVNITRVERVGGQLQPEEDVLLSIRRSPKAVRLEWAKGPSKGREVIYSAAINDRIMYVNMANSPLPLSRMSIPVDSPLALRNSRHPITEAGFDTIFQSLFQFQALKATDVPGLGKLVYKGIERPKGLDLPCHLIERASPQGERWQVYLDTRTLMPAMVAAYQTSNGELIERYTYRNLKPNPSDLASAEAFDPDRRWGESKGWLSRLARGAGASPGANSGQTATR
jgi:hypothetical protein